MKTKSKLGGKKISRKEAFKNLGDPKMWERERVALMKKFKEKPKLK